MMFLASEWMRRTWYLRLDRLPKSVPQCGHLPGHGPDDDDEEPVPEPEPGGPVGGEVEVGRG